MVPGSLRLVCVLVAAKSERATQRVALSGVRLAGEPLSRRLSGHSQGQCDVVP